MVQAFAPGSEVQGSPGSLTSAAPPADSAALPPLPSPLLTTTSDVSSQIQQVHSSKNCITFAHEWQKPTLRCNTTSHTTFVCIQAGRQARLSFSNSEESKPPLASKSALLRNWSGSGDMWDSARDLHTLPGQVVGVASPQTQARPCFLRQLADAARRCA